MSHRWFAIGGVLLDFKNIPQTPLTVRKFEGKLVRCLTEF